MPRLSGRKRAYKKKRRGTSMVSVAKRAVRQELRRNVELKRRYGTQTETSISTVNQGGNWHALSNVDLGTGRDNRIGHEIIAKGIHVAGHLHNNGAGTNYVRMVILEERTQADFTGVEKLFEGATATQDFTGVNSMSAMYYPIQKVDYKVFYDKVFKLNPVASTGKNDESRMFKKFIKLNRKMLFENQTSQGAAVQRPRYWIGFWAAESARDEGLGQNIEMSMLTRFYFTDM